MTPVAAPAQTCGTTELSTAEARATDGGGWWDWLFGPAAGGGGSSGFG